MKSEALGVPGAASCSGARCSSPGRGEPVARVRRSTPYPDSFTLAAEFRPPGLAALGTEGALSRPPSPAPPPRPASPCSPGLDELSPAAQAEAICTVVQSLARQGDWLALKIYLVQVGHDMMNRIPDDVRLSAAHRRLTAVKDQAARRPWRDFAPPSQPPPPPPRRPGAWGRLLRPLAARRPAP